MEKSYVGESLKHIIFLHKKLRVNNQSIRNGGCVVDGYMLYILVKAWVPIEVEGVTDDVTYDTRGSRKNFYNQSFV
jgi:hypothetical protein